MTEKVKLNEITDIYLGVTHTPEYVLDGVPFLSVKDISGGKICFDECKFISQKEYNSLSEGAKPKVGDMLFCRVGTIGKPIIIPEGTPLFGSFVSLGYLRNKAKDRCNLNYLRYWMYSNSFWKQVNKNVKGASQVNLNTGWLSNFEIRLPDFSEQTYIVSILDKCKLIIERREEELKKFDNLIRARFVEMFGEGLKDDGKFKLKPISEIGQVVSGATPKTSRYEYWNGDNVWITPAELSDESFVIYDSERKLTYEGVDSCAVTLLPVGTVILSSRAPIGKVAIAGVEMYCNQGFKNIIPRNVVSSIYLYELLKMETEYLKSLGRGATFKEISKQIVENIRVKVPPIELQNQFATFVNHVNKSRLLAISQPQIHIYKTLTLL